jgi:hypothetical protein
MYNLTQIQGTGVNVYSLILFGNEATSGLLVGGLVIAIFFVMLFRISSRNDLPISLLVSSLMCFFLSGILAFAGLVGLIFPLTFLIVLAFDGLFITSTQRGAY